MTVNKHIILAWLLTMIIVMLLYTKIEIREERIWKLEIENQDLKEQIYELEHSGGYSE